jgi:hypothetical protein
MMKRGALIALATAWTIGAACSPADAQRTVQILTPTTDTCRAYTAATVARDQNALLGLGGWVVGYLSGFAQGAQIDFLKNETVAGLSRRLYDACLKRPEMPLSIAAHGLAKEVILEHRGR